jgi:hypothetical protein
MKVFIVDRGILVKLKNHSFLNIVLHERFSSFSCQKFTLEYYTSNLDTPC